MMAKKPLMNFYDSNGISNIRITEVDENGRARQASPRRGERRDTRRDRDDVDGYDYYRWV